MYLESRRKKIIAILKDVKTCSVEQLATSLNVSLVTIRKDLDYLENLNLIVRTHGGAILAEEFLSDTPYDVKKTMEIVEKQSICQLASENVNDGDIILIDSGSTITELCNYLKEKKDLTIITCNLEAALITSYFKNIKCFFIGGEVSSNSKSCTGANVIHYLRDFHVNISFIGCDGFDLEQGAYTTSLERSYIKQKSMEIADKSILLATGNKYQQKKLVCFSPLNHFFLSVFDHQNIALIEDLKQTELNYIITT